VFTWNMLSLNDTRPFEVNPIIKPYGFGSKRTISYHLKRGVTYIVEKGYLSWVS
jgi:hypothetical protein